MNKISEVRKRVSVTQAQLAEVLDFGQGRIANYELGTRTPSLATARKIVEALNRFGAEVTIDDVFPPENG
ncbi:transcriptional regulator [Pasteurellaceae bacterium 15-036681]|nr:transcriptional regulator [Pasteurellaceae bacterium 15-036681]